MEHVLNVDTGVDRETDPDTRTPFSGAYRTVTIGIMVTVTMIAFEAMAVGPALPSAARELHGLAAYGWAFTAFLLANIIGMVVAGQLSDTVGPRPPLVAGVALFVVGLGVAGSAGTMTQLIGARAVQGLGSGLVITAIYVVLGEIYPSRLQPRVFTVISAAWLLPSLVGPALSGVITQQLSWRWVFLGLLPFVLLGSALLVPAMRSLGRAPSQATTAGIDRIRIIRAFVLAGGAAALAEAGRSLTALTPVYAVVGLAALAWSLRGLLPPGHIRNVPGVASAVALRALLASALFGGETIVPLMLQTQHGLGATAAGLPLTASGLAWSAASWWQSREVGGDPDVRRTRLMRIGFVSLSVGLALVTVTSLRSVPWWLAFPAWAFAGLGAGLSITIAGVLLLRNTTDAERGRDSAALQLADTTASSLTTGVTGVLVALAVAGTVSTTTSFVTIGLVMLVIALIGVAVSGRARTVGS